MQISGSHLENAQQNCIMIESHSDLKQYAQSFLEEEILAERKFGGISRNLIGRIKKICKFGENLIWWMQNIIKFGRNLICRMTK